MRKNNYMDLFFSPRSVHEILEWAQARVCILILFLLSEERPFQIRKFVTEFFIIFQQIVDSAKKIGSPIVFRGTSPISQIFETNFMSTNSVSTYSCDYRPEWRISYQQQKEHIQTKVEVSGRLQIQIQSSILELRTLCCRNTIWENIQFAGWLIAKLFMCAGIVLIQF